MKILDVYQKYNIPKNLQDHQFRVAAVASLILDNDSRKFDRDIVVTTCLLHDMGNIIKSDFDVLPEFLEPEGRDYWQRIKDEFIEKYGPDEDKATIKIAKELNVSPKVLKILKNFKYKDKLVADIDEYINICIYADARVAPHGVVGLMDRVDDGEKRYLNREDRNYSEEYFNDMRRIWPIREKTILKTSKLSSEDINEKSIKPIFEELIKYKLFTPKIPD